jgi:hypothetical protein
VTAPDVDRADDPVPVGAGSTAAGTDAGTAPGAVGADGPGDEPDAPPRSARVFVAVLFVLLLVPGLVGFDAWPLTGWRLFSLSRDADQTRWVLDAVDEDGGHRIVSLEELTLGYRHAEWPMAELPGASVERRDRVCEALLDAVRDVRPTTVRLVVSRDHTRLVRRDGEWITEHDVEPFHPCAVGEPLGTVVR